jgi:hypothetical protein
MKTKILLICCVLGLIACLFSVPAQAATSEEIQQSIDDGIDWLVTQQYADGSWGASEKVAHTGLAVLKLEDRAFETGYDPFDPAYEYSDEVIAGLNYIFSQANQPSCCQVGITLTDNSWHETYNTGIGMMAIAASRAPGGVVPVLGSLVDGWTYEEVVQACVDFFECSQNPDGGWRYICNDQPSDNSNTGYATLGLRYAEVFGISIPQPLKDNLSIYVDSIQDPVNGDANDGGSDYTVGWNWFNILKTGNLLFEMAFVGDGPGTQRAIDAVDYIERHWNDPNVDPGWRIHYQAMYCLMKGFEAMGIETIEVGGNPVDWYDEIADVIVQSQNADGSWPSDYWGNSILSTAWALLTLELVAPPPPVIEVPVDIHPTSCPNPLNVKKKGVVPVAILGTEDFDVTQIDPASVMLEGVAPLRWNLEDVATPYVEPFSDPAGCMECTEEGSDGFMDLTLKFDAQEIVAAIGEVEDGQCLLMTLTGNLMEEFNGTEIIGQDVVKIIVKGK